MLLRVGKGDAAGEGREIGIGARTGRPGGSGIGRMVGQCQGIAQAQIGPCQAVLIRMFGQQPLSRLDGAAKVNPRRGCPAEPIRPVEVVQSANMQASQSFWRRRRISSTDANRRGGEIPFVEEIVAGKLIDVGQR